MGHYDEIRKMKEQIDRILLSTQTTGAIDYNLFKHQIMRNFAVSPKSFNQYITSLETVGYIEIDKDSKTIKWIN